MNDTSSEANPQEEHLQQQDKDKTAENELAIIEEEDVGVKKPTPEVIVERRPDVHYTGFMRPFHPLQIVSWVVFFFDLLTYFLINMVSLQNHSLALVICCSIIYLVISGLVLYYAIRATKVDPSDPLIYQQRLVEAQG